MFTHALPVLETKSITDNLDPEHPYHKLLVDFGVEYIAVDNKIKEESPYIRERQRKALLQRICDVTCKNMEPFTKADIPKFSCFPGNGMCVTNDGQNIPMSQLKAGDRVLTADSTGGLLYEDLFLWSHAIPHTKATFISVTTEHGKVLRLSPGHFLHVQAIGNLLRAQDVRPRDIIFAVHPDLSIMRKERVVSVERVAGRGLYCPHTTGGSLVVDGVIVSCYTDLFPPTITHHVLAPVRFLYHTLPASYFSFLLPYDQESGMPKLLLYLRWLLCHCKQVIPRPPREISQTPRWLLGALLQFSAPGQIDKIQASSY